MYRLYDYLASGNGYKVRLLLTQLQISFEYIELDIVAGQTRTDDYLRKIPTAKFRCWRLPPTSIWLSQTQFCCT